MKITRQFTFYPTWSSRHFSYENYEDLFPIPEFNVIARFLEDKGWEISSFEYCKDDDYGFGAPNPSMKSLIVYCTKPKSKFKEEEKYDYYSKSKDGDLE